MKFWRLGFTTSEWWDIWDGLLAGRGLSLVQMLPADTLHSYTRESLSVNNHCCVWSQCSLGCISWLKLARVNLMFFLKDFWLIIFYDFFFCASLLLYMGTCIVSILYVATCIIYHPFNKIAYSDLQDYKIDWRLTQNENLENLIDFQSNQNW